MKKIPLFLGEGLELTIRRIRLIFLRLLNLLGSSWLDLDIHHYPFFAPLFFQSSFRGAISPTLFLLSHLSIG